MDMMSDHTARTAKGHEEPLAVQFSVFLANRVGSLKDLLDLFAGQDINVLGLSVVDSADWAVIRIVVSDPNKARDALSRAAVPFTESEVLLAELDGPTALSEIFRLLLQMEINTHFAYPLTIRRDQNPIMVLHVDDHVLARGMLLRHGITLLGDEDLAGPTS